TPFRPTPRHPTTAQQTSGTADCSRAAPSTAAPSAPNRTPATAEREATAQAGSTAGQVERRAFQIPATVPPAPHPRSAGSTATDDLLEPAPRSSRSRTAHRSSHPNRASDVPHISSRSADYTPTPGPIERLFPHPARAPAGRAGGAVTDTTLRRLAERLSAMERATLQGGRRIANRLWAAHRGGPRVRIPSPPSAVNRGVVGEKSRLYPWRRG